MGDTEDHSFLLSNAQKQKPPQEIVPAGTGALVAKNGNLKNPGGPGLRCGSVPSLLGRWKSLPVLLPGKERRKHFSKHLELSVL